MTKQRYTFDNIDPKAAPSDADVTAVSAICRAYGEETNVIYAGVFFQHTSHDRTLWNHLIQDSEIPDGGLGAAWARKNGLYSKSRIIQPDYR